MPSCVILTPFPLAVPKHGGQVRAASMAKALKRAGWYVQTVGIYHAKFFPLEEWGALDIVLMDTDLGKDALADVLFGDLHIAEGAAQDPEIVETFRRLLARLAPDVVLVEHPWDWLILRQALPEQNPPRIVYSSQNIEWSARPAFFKLGLKRPGAEARVEQTRLLEREFARRADLVLSISDLEAAEIERESGRPVVYMPAVSDLAEPEDAAQLRFGGEAGRRYRYAALMSSAYWPNVEGFFDMFPEGLGFLAQGEQIWVAGSLGDALRRDIRYQDFLTINDSRMHSVGYVSDAQKGSFFASAACVLAPVRMGAGAKLKTADAVASGCPVIATPHAVEGYGPVIAEALGRGVYVADTPAAYRALVRQALREGLPGCSAEVRGRLALGRMAESLDGHLRTLLASPPP